MILRASSSTSGPPPVSSTPSGTGTAVGKARAAKVTLACRPSARRRACIFPSRRSSPCNSGSAPSRTRRERSSCTSTARPSAKRAFAQGDGFREFVIPISAADLRAGENSIMLRATKTAQVRGKARSLAMDWLLFEPGSAESTTPPRRVAVEQISVGGVARRAIALAPGAQVDWFVEVPEDGALVFGSGLKSPGAGALGVADRQRRVGWLDSAARRRAVLERSTGLAEGPRRQNRALALPKRGSHRAGPQRCTRRAALGGGGDHRRARPQRHRPSRRHPAREQAAGLLPERPA